MKTIYLYHLIQDGRIRYVGVTTDITTRKSYHKRTKPPHTFEIIDIFTDKEEAGIAEQYHIAGHNTFLDGWNNSIGGETLLTGENHPSWIDGLSVLDKKAYMKIYNQLPEVKAKMKEYQQTPEYKAKAIERMRRHRQRPEVIERLKEYHRIRSQTPEYKAYRKKLEQTPEFKARQKERDKKRNATPERKKYHREYMKEYRARKKALANT